MSRVLDPAPAGPAEAAAHFAAQLRFQTDASDVHADLAAGVAGLVVVDARGAEAYHAAHLPGAVHVTDARIPAGATVVTYCWGPGCNGATRAALAFATRGHPVKEMIGGYEYWVREGFPVDTPDGPRRRPVDDLAAVPAGRCDC